MIVTPKVVTGIPQPKDFEEAKAELAIAYQRIHDLEVMLTGIRLLAEQGEPKCGA